MQRKERENETESVEKQNLSSDLIGSKEQDSATGDENDIGRRCR